MDGIRPDEIKKHAIAFKNYYKEYLKIWDNYLEHLTSGEEICYEHKSDEQLYNEFVEGKPVSL